MGVNKVEYGGRTLIDLTNDTVTPETLVKGATAHNAAGEQIEGQNAGSSGDMLKSDYDPEGAVQEAGGIAAYVASEVSPAVSGVESAKGVSVALDPSKWSSSAPYTQTVTVSWMTSDWAPGQPSLNVDACNGNVSQIQARKEEYAKLDIVTSGAGTLTFTAFEDKPTEWLDIDIPRFVRRG